MQTRRRDPTAAAFALECYWPGLTGDALSEAEQRVRNASTPSDGDGVRYRGSLLFPHDETVFLLFAGPSTDAVRTVGIRAQLPFERVLDAVAAGPLANAFAAEQTDPHQEGAR
jgi:hypothetical protein